MAFSHLPAGSYDPSQLGVLRQVLGDLAAAPNKTLGQNFLIDGAILDQITGAALLQKTDTVLEIGPGLGALSVRLLEAAGTVIAIEKDRKFAPFLQKKLPALKVIEADALDISWQQLGLPANNVKIVANLPYAISKPLIRRILEEWRPHLTSATILVQREVAARLKGVPGGKDYGPMGIMSALYCRATPVLDVPPEAFLPSPHVVSTAIHLEMLEAPSIELQNEKRFWTTVTAAFAQRRKTLGNTLKPLAPREKISAAFEQTGIDPMRRGETLSIREFAALSDAIFS